MRATRVTSARDPARGPAPDAAELPGFLPRLLLLAVPVVLYVTGFGVSQLVQQPGDWLAGWPALVVLVGAGLHALHQFRRRERPVLRLDGVGTWDREGQRLHAWPGTAQVWVGSVTGSHGPAAWRIPALVVRTAAGLDLGRRAGTGPAPAGNLPVATRLSASEVAAVVRRFTTARVATADDVPLAELGRRLLGGPTPGPRPSTCRPHWSGCSVPPCGGWRSACCPHPARGRRAGRSAGRARRRPVENGAEVSRHDLGRALTADHR